MERKTTLQTLLVISQVIILKAFSKKRENFKTFSQQAEAIKQLLYVCKVRKNRASELMDIGRKTAAFTEPI